MPINIKKSDVIWSYFSLFLFNGINILLLPFILSYLSSAEVGLWYTFTAVSGLVVLLDMGFMTTLSRNVTFVWSGAEEIYSSGFKDVLDTDKKPNYLLFVKLFKTTKLIYLGIGFAILTILLTVGSIYIYYVSKNELPIILIMVSWVFYSLAVFLNMRYAYWNAILKGIGAIKENQKLLIITKLSQLIFTIFTLMLGWGLIGVAVSYLISILINRILAHFTFIAYQDNRHEVKPLLKAKVKVNYKEIIKKLLPNTYKQAMISLSNYINLRSTTLFSSAFLGLNVSASFGLVLQIVNLITVVANTFFNTYLPQFGFYRLRGENNLLKNTFKKAILMNYSIVLVAFIGVLVIGDYVLLLLNSNVELLPWPYLITIMVYMFLYNNQSVFATFIGTKNILPHYRSFFVSSLIIIVIQLFLMFKFEPNLWLIILPILFVQMLYNNWKWPYVVWKELRQY